MLDNEYIEQARNTDLAQYLLSIGEPLERSGRRYKHKNHDSLVFTDNRYYWNSRQDRGNAVDYLQRYMNMSFIDAIDTLLGFDSSAFKQENISVELSEIKTANDYKRVIAYLSKGRCIDYKIIKRLIDSKHLVQEDKTNNAVFLTYNELNQYVGAETIGTLSNIRFKNVKEGSEYGYGFNVRFSKDNTFKYALFFESAVDLISFIEIKQNYEKKNLGDCILISMGGLKKNIIEHTLKAFEGDLQVILCVDNDNAGQAFIEAIKETEINFKLRLPQAEYKDWNDQLKAYKNIKSDK